MFGSRVLRVRTDFANAEGLVKNRTRGSLKQPLPRRGLRPGQQCPHTDEVAGDIQAPVRAAQKDHQQLISLRRVRTIASATPSAASFSDSLDEHPCISSPYKSPCLTDT